MALDEESQMRINEPRPPVVMERGHCKSIRDASWGELDYPQEPLPEAIEICCACWTELNGGTG